MSAAVINGDQGQKTTTTNRTERRKEWWNKAKDFKSKLRDRGTLAKKENEHQSQTQLSAPTQVDTARGFRSSTIVSRMSSAPAPASRMSASASTSGKSFSDTKKQLAMSSKQKVGGGHVKVKLSPKAPPAMQKRKSAQKSSPQKAKVVDKAAVAEIIFSKPEMAEISLNARGVELTNMANHLNPRYVLFVGNLPYSIDKGQLMSHFRKAAGVKSIRIPKDKTGKGKGFAYIEFKDRISHGIALRLHHTTLAGRRINVEFTNDDKKKSSSESS